MRHATLSEGLRGHRFLEMDCLRGLAALIVVLSHLHGLWATSKVNWWIDVLPTNMFVAGGSAVMIFFVLSGFVLTRPYQSANPPSYHSYAVKRFCRLYLPYVAALLIAVGARLLVKSPVYIGADWLDATWNTPVTLSHVLDHLSGVGTFDTREFNGPFWTLVQEFRISLFMPLIAWLALRLRARTVLLVSMLVLILMTAVNLPHPFRVFQVTLLYVPNFLLGALLAAQFDRVPQWWMRTGRKRKFTLLAVALAIFGYYPFLPALAPALHHRNLLGIVVKSSENCLLAFASVYILVIATQSTRVRHWLHHRVLLHLGKISFSLYLLHLLLLLLFVHTVWAKWGHVSQGYELLLLPPYLGLAYLLALAFHHAVELPTIRLGRWMEKRIGQISSHHHHQTQELHSSHTGMTG